METDLIFNVAQLLKEPVGTHRDYDFEVPTLELSDGAMATGLQGHVRMTRLNKSVLTVGKARLEAVPMECGRCLETFTAPLAITFEDRYYPTIDVQGGGKIAFGEEAANGEQEVDALLIDHNHLLDLSELLRQTFLIAMPLLPLCRLDCPGLPVPEGVSLNLVREDEEDDEAPIDSRLAALAKLLNGKNDDLPLELAFSIIPLPLGEVR